MGGINEMITSSGSNRQRVRDLSLMTQAERRTNILENSRSGLSSRQIVESQTLPTQLRSKKNQEVSARRRYGSAASTVLPMQLKSKLGG